MKKVILVLTSLFGMLAHSNSWGQDILYFTDGSELEVKLIEVLPTQVKYKRSDNLDGPVITQDRANLFMVKYENGTKEKLMVQNEGDGNDKLTPEDNSSNIQASPSSAVTIIDDADRVRKDKWGSTYNENMARHKKKRNLGIGFLSAGAPSFFVGVLLTVNVIRWDARGFLYDQWIGDGVDLILPVAIGGLGLISTITGASLLGSSKKYKKRADELVFEPVLIRTTEFDMAQTKNRPSYGCKLTFKF